MTAEKRESMDDLVIGGTYSQKVHPELVGLLTSDQYLKVHKPGEQFKARRRTGSVDRWWAEMSIITGRWRWFEKSLSK